MRNIPIFSSEAHKFILLNEVEPGEEDGRGRFGRPQAQLSCLVQNNL